jgi:hypothetical protein
LDIKAWRNNTGLVQPPVQLDNYLPRTVIVDDIKVTNVAYPSDVSSEVIDKGVIQDGESKTLCGLLCEPKSVNIGICAVWLDRDVPVSER